MELLLALRLPFSDHAQELRDSLLNLTGHDISEHLGFTTLTLVQATIHHWHDFSGPQDVLLDAVAGGLARMLPRFSIPHPIYQDALLAIVTTLSRFYNELYGFLDPLINALGGEHRIKAISQPKHGQTIELTVLRVTA